MKNNRELFDAGRNGVKLLLGSRRPAAAIPQEQMLDLLAGSSDR